MVIEADLPQLWRERALGQYLRGEATREQAIERVGLACVELAEQQYTAMIEDLAWGARGDT